MKVNKILLSSYILAIIATIIFIAIYYNQMSAYCSLHRGPSGCGEGPAVAGIALIAIFMIIAIHAIIIFIGALISFIINRSKVALVIGIVALIIIIVQGIIIANQFSYVCFGEQSGCWRNYAVRNINSDYCNKIPSQIYADDCKRAVISEKTVKNSDVSLCGGFGEVYFDMCICRFFYDTKLQVTECTKIQNCTERNQCYMVYSKLIKEGCHTEYGKQMFIESMPSLKNIECADITSNENCFKSVARDKDSYDFLVEQYC